MPSHPPTVFVLDPDASVRQSLESTIRRAGWTPEITASLQTFFARPPLQAPSCLLLDLGDSQPDLSGLELLRRIASERKEIPVVALSGEPSIPLAVRAMRAGAFEFLVKPFCDDALHGTLERALEQSETVMQHEADLLALRHRHDSLSGRERDVMARVVSGFLNKQVGADLGIREITVKVYRGRVMRKMGADSLAELVRMAQRLGIARLRYHRAMDQPRRAIDQTRGLVTV